MLFKLALIEKIKEGQKTQTRRIIKEGEYAYTLPGEDSIHEVYMYKGKRRTKWVVGRIYAVCPGRGKAATEHIRLLAIRVESIDDIKEQDAWAEGCSGYTKYTLQPGEQFVMEPDYVVTPREEFFELWNSIHGVLAALQNPKVWVLTFEYMQ